MVTAAYIVMSLAFPGFERSYGLDFIAASFFFIPMQNADGAAMPIIGHGWTLNYEMMFYAVFALAVFAPRRLAVALVSVALAAAIILGELLIPSSTAWAFWTSPLIIQFIYGMLIGLFYREGLRLAKPLAVALIVAGCTLIFVFRDSSFDALPHALLAGFPAALVVAAATFGSFSLAGSVWRLLATIGDASYAIYLLHSVPIRGALFLSRSTSLDFASAPWLYVGLAMIGAIVLWIAIYYLLERPVTRYLRSLLKPRKLVQASAA
jgi:peptidoglycan/LPS O-acetylase OafA/YrhL